MYGLVVKTSFGVRRLSFMSPHFRVGRHIVFAMVVRPSVSTSVRPSVRPSDRLSLSIPHKIVSAL